MRFLMKTLGLTSHVDECHYSAAIGHRKPERELFTIVASKIGLPPKELFLLDDSKENVEAAINAGWQAACWTGRDKLCELIK